MPHVVDSLLLDEVVTTVGATTNYNNFALGSASHALFRAATGAFTVTGVTGGAAGKTIRIINSSGQEMTLAHESASSTAANRIWLPGATDLVVPDDSSAILIYNNTDSRWVLGAVGSSAAAATNVFTARKGSAGTITKGQAVYISGYSGGFIQVELAQANAVGTMPALGVANASITSAAEGEVVIVGEVIGISTAAFAVSTDLYVSAATPGALTATKPTGATNLVQKIAEVTRQDASLGQIVVFGAGRQNDLPNLAQSNLWLGNASGVPTPTLVTEVFADGQADIAIFEHFVTGAVSGAGVIGSYAWDVATQGGTVSFEGYSGRPGVVILTVGTATANRATINLGSNTNANKNIRIAGSNTLTLEAVVRIEGSVAAADLETAHIGFGDSWEAIQPLGNFLGIYFNPTLSANWQIRAKTGASVTNSAGTTTVVLDTWYRLKMVVTNPGTSPSAQLYVNGVAQGSPITTNIPTAILLGTGLKIDSNGGSIGPILEADWILVRQRNEAA